MAEAAPIEGLDYGPPETQAIRVRRRDAAVWIQLHRPEAMNSVNPAMVREIHAVLDAVQQDSEVRCIVFTGVGRAFCAGADLKEAQRPGDEIAAQAASAAAMQAVVDLLNRVEAFGLPVIAAVNGLALAGGLEIVLCCDLVVAAETARFGDAHAKLGLLPGWGASARLPRKIGVNRAKEMMFTAAQMSASTMCDWGLVNRVAPADGLIEAVDALVEDLATKSPLGLRRMKQLIDDGVEQPLSVALRNEQVMAAAHHHSHDRREGIAAFAERRPPRFLGR